MLFFVGVSKCLTGRINTQFLMTKYVYINKGSVSKSELKNL